MAAVISFSNVTHKTLFEQLGFDIEAGTSTLLVTSREDESSALLRLLVGMVRPQSGSLHVLDQFVTDLSPDQLYQLRRQIGCIPFQGGLVSNLKMWENITLPLLYANGAVDESQTETALAYLERLEFRGEVMVLPAHLTLYEKRITAFVRAALQQPQLMVYCNSLDGISNAARAIFSSVALDFHRSSPGRTSLFLTSSADVAKELAVDVQFTVHEPSPSKRTT